MLTRKQYNVLLDLYSIMPAAFNALPDNITGAFRAHLHNPAMEFLPEEV